MAQPPIEWPTHPRYVESQEKPADAPFDWEDDTFLSTNTQTELFLERHAGKLIIGGVLSTVVGVVTINSLPAELNTLQYIVTDLPNIVLAAAGAGSVTLGCFAYSERRSRIKRQASAGQQGSDTVQ
jgi:hypothetical protein